MNAPSHTRPHSTRLGLLLLGGALHHGCGAPDAAEDTPTPPMVPSALTLSSPAIAHVETCSDSSPSTCAIIPDVNASYTGGGNISPELRWTGVPAGTLSFAITLTDITYGQPHWMLWNIPGDLTQLPADVSKASAMPPVPAGALQTNATFADGDGYFGPQAPCNVYSFELFALSVATFTPTQPEFVALVHAELLELGGAILGRSTLTARTNQMLMCP